MIRFFIFISLSLIIFQATAQNHMPLRQEVQDIIQNKKATIGVAIIYDGTDTLTMNNQYR